MLLGRMWKSYYLLVIGDKKMMQGLEMEFHRFEYKLLHYDLS